MHGMKKSDEAVLPLKAANKGAQTPAESPEGRASTKGNLRDQSTLRTQGRGRPIRWPEPRVSSARTCSMPPAPESARRVAAMILRRNG